MAIGQIKYNDEYIFINDEVNEEDTGIMISKEDLAIEESQNYGDNYE